MQRQTRNKKEVYAAFSLPDGITLYSEDYYLDALRPLGMSRRGFRAWLRCLSVPTLEVANTRYLDPWSFNLALKAILRIGEPDFFAPGSMGLRRGHPAGVTTLDPATFRRNLRVVVAELVASKTRPYSPPPAQVKRAARLAAQRMMDMGIQAIPTVLAAAKAEREIAIQRIPTDVG